MTEPSGLTAAVQDYAKAIYALESRAGVASTNALAERLGVRPGSVSGMLRKLDALGLVVHERVGRGNSDFGAELGFSTPTGFPLSGCADVLA